MKIGGTYYTRGFGNRTVTRVTTLEKREYDVWVVQDIIKLQYGRLGTELFESRIEHIQYSRQHARQLAELLGDDINKAHYDSLMEYANLLDRLFPNLNEDVMTLDVPLDKINVVGHNEKSHWQTITLLIPGLASAGYSVGYVPPGQKAVKKYGGGLVEGPWAYAFPHALILDTQGGTRRELQIAAQEDMVLECEKGDILRIDGNEFRIKVVDHNYNIELTLDTNP